MTRLLLIVDVNCLWNVVSLGSWSLQLEGAGQVCILRSLLWPGLTLYHVLMTPQHGYIYIGSGVKNLDLPFMLWSQSTPCFNCLNSADFIPYVTRYGKCEICVFTLILKRIRLLSLLYNKCWEHFIHMLVCSRVYTVSTTYFETGALTPDDAHIKLTQSLPQGLLENWQRQNGCF